MTDETLRALYELLKWGPTAFNAQPGRYVFVRSAAAKTRLAETLSSGNKAKTLAAPVTCIVAYDTRFYDLLPAGGSAAGLLRGNGSLAEATAFRNSSLQGAYLVLAARALGLAAGPMSGFDPARLNAEFFADSTWTTSVAGAARSRRADSIRSRPLPFKSLSKSGDVTCAGSMSTLGSSSASAGAGSRPATAYGDRTRV